MTRSPFIFPPQFVRFGSALEAEYYFLHLAEDGLMKRIEAEAALGGGATTESAALLHDLRALRQILTHETWRDRNGRPEVS